MADILKELIAQKRHQYDSISKGSNKRFIKRSEIMNLTEPNIEQLQDIKSSQSPLNNSTIKQEETFIKPEEQRTKTSVPRKEVIRRLRELKEPILLFGETEYNAYYRLRKLEIAEPDINLFYQNDFREAMARVDEDYLTEKMGSEGNTTSNQSSTTGNSLTQYTIKYFVDLQDTLIIRHNESVTCEQSKLVADYLQFIVCRWSELLSKRSDSEKMSSEGKKVSAIHRQTIEYLRPMFKMLRNETLNTDILEGLVNLVRNMIDRNYIKANDLYLEIAIGNAPWPIGVTMVGIHARPGREKVSSKYVAHVLNDETQRKFLQAVKRLITQNQELYGTFPHRSVNYIKK